MSFDNFKFFNLVFFKKTKNVGSYRKNNACLWVPRLEVEHYQHSADGEGELDCLSRQAGEVHWILSPRRFLEVFNLTDCFFFEVIGTQFRSLV
jgi:hypothetical protein